ncbi:MAG: c-type cytochrome [Planctomycetales bacterium]
MSQPTATRKRRPQKTQRRQAARTAFSLAEIGEHMINRILLVAAAVALAVSFTAVASAGKPKKNVDYLRDVKPILKARCRDCHGGAKQESGLRLDSAEGVLQGGDSGPAVVPGESEKSLLMEMITRDDEYGMPPKGEPLTDKQIETLRRWIDQGAETPDQE